MSSKWFGWYFLSCMFWVFGAVNLFVQALNWSDTSNVPNAIANWILIALSYVASEWAVNKSYKYKTLG